MLTDDQKKSQPLLEQYGIIITPVDVDDDFYIHMSWALHAGRQLHPDKPLELRCHGNGGDTAVAFAVADLIELDGNIDGIGLGDVASAHAIIWMACTRRYVYSRTLFMVHPVATGQWEARLHGSDYVLRGSQLEWRDSQVIDMCVKASTNSQEWWRERYFKSGYALYYMKAEEIISCGLAKPINERGKA